MIKQNVRDDRRVFLDKVKDNVIKTAMHLYATHLS